MLRLIHSIADMVFPPTCAGCGCEPGTGEGALCWTCRESLVLLGKPMCSVCGVPVHGRVDHEFTCHDCSARPPRFASARAAVLYKGVGRHLLTRFKYSYALATEPLLVDLVEQCVRYHHAELNFDLICPVPLHPVRQRERGFNQARLIARGLSRRLGVPLTARHALIRTKRTGTQTRLTARQRVTNVVGAFKAGPSRQIADRRILLVDDVMTTGATVGACAKTLIDGGARSVHVVTVARGI